MRCSLTDGYSARYELLIILLKSSIVGAHKHSRSVHALVIVYRYCKSFVELNIKIIHWPKLESFVGLKTGHKRINIATYHEQCSLSCCNVIILGD